MKTITLETKRLYLRQWHDDDLPMFAQLNTDPKVMEYFPKPLTRQESNAMAEKIRALIAERGWGWINIITQNDKNNPCCLMLTITTHYLQAYHHMHKYYQSYLNCIFVALDVVFDLSYNRLED